MTDEREFDVLYLCDGGACECCHPEDCQHTTDITHAINFVKYRISDTKDAYFEHDTQMLITRNVLIDSSKIKKEVRRMRKENEDEKNTDIV